MTGVSIGRARLESITSVLLAFMLPIAVGLQMEVGGALGVPSEDPSPPLDYWLRSVLWAASFLAPFVVGALLGVHAVWQRPTAGWRVLARLGIAGNVGVITIAVLFAVGEVVNPH